MEIKEIIERNYAATLKRGLITDKTGFREFSEKLFEEVIEFENEIYVKDTPDYADEYVGVWDLADKKKTSFELADIILTAFSFARHYEIDILKVLEEKMLINEKR